MWTLEHCDWTPVPPPFSRRGPCRLQGGSSPQPGAQAEPFFQTTMRGLGSPPLCPGCLSQATAC